MLQALNKILAPALHVFHFCKCAPTVNDMQDYPNTQYSLSSNPELTCMQIPKIYTFQYA